MLESNSLRDNRCDSSRTMSRGAAAPLFNPSSRRRHRTDRSPMPRKLHCIHKRNRPPASARSAQTDLECVTYVSGTNCYPCVRSGHFKLWCGEGDLNPHEITPASTSTYPKHPVRRIYSGLRRYFRSHRVPSRISIGTNTSQNLCRQPVVVGGEA
jgi:hypothetical protein